MATVAGTDVYYTFIVVDEGDEGLALFQTEQILDTKDPLRDYDSQVDWDGAHWGHNVLMCGVRVKDKWHCVGRRERR